MPNYDYQCEDCEHVQEENHPMAGPKEEIVCQKCKSKKMKKYYGTRAPGAIFKGEDWATNKYR